MTNQETTSGMFYVDNGFRLCIAKSGYKWAYLVYINANKLKCKKLRNQKTGKPRPIPGHTRYNTADVARSFLNGRSLNGTTRIMSKRAKSILQDIVRVQ